MGYVIFAASAAIGIGLMFVASTDFKGLMTNLFATKKPVSFGVKAIAGSVRQLRGWYFLMGALATLIGTVGIFALLNANH